MTDSLLDDLETLIRRDPAMRGLISSEAKFGRLCEGHFAAAAQSLAEPDAQSGDRDGFLSCREPTRRPPKRTARRGRFVWPLPWKQWGIK